jgi:hypothetical protein
MRAEGKVIDKIVNRLKFHSWRAGLKVQNGPPMPALKASCRDVSRHDQEG